MDFDQEKMQSHAHKLALEHEPRSKRVSSRTLKHKLNNDMAGLRAFIAELQEQSSPWQQPAEEWLLDHAEFIESELSGIGLDLDEFRTLSLPVVEGGSEPRVSSICRAYLDYADGLLEEESFSAYLRFYQEVAVLTSAETWHLPLFLKMNLIARLSELTEPLKERRAIGRQVEAMLEGIPAAELNPERFKRALDEAGVELPLSGAMIVHLVRHLREHAEDSAHVGEWLVCKLDNASEDLDSILSYEYRLQAVYQASTGNAIGSLRKLSRWVWSGLFEDISIIERTLRTELAGDYPRLDSGSRHTLRCRVEKLAAAMNVPENLVASQAAALADASFRKAEEESEGEKSPDIRQNASNGDGSLPSGDSRSALLPRSAYAAYYLLDPSGMGVLRKALKLCGKTRSLPSASIRQRASALYIQLLVAATAAAMVCFALFIGPADSASALLWGTSVLLLLPASEWGVTAVHWLIAAITKPMRLLRYDFSEGVPPEAATMVVIPVIWSRPDHVLATVDRLEQHYLGNRDPHIRFAVLSDFHDAATETTPEDKELLELASKEIGRLSREHGECFHLFHRRRQWNESERAWMGWERKRGKLEEFARLLGGDGSTSFSVKLGDQGALRQIRYVLTLDADTRLPLESARRMIGAIHLPYNRARLNNEGTRVTEGYGILQPRIGMTYESAQRSRLTALYAAEAGLDPYAFAVSDPYQDAMGQGIFTGKGIFDLSVFRHMLDRRFPDNRILSHDLLEGGFLRAGLLSDIELIDDHPPTFLAHQRRLHRWMRGDWQLIPWLRRSVRNGKGELARTHLSALTRWQITDNLRRSLLAPALLAVLLASPILPGGMRYAAVSLATLLLPFVRQLLSKHALLYHPDGLLRTLAHAVLSFLTLPYQTALALDAILRTLYRLFFSRKRLLEWTSQAEVERASSGRAAPLAGMAGGYAFAAAMAIIALSSDSLFARAAGLAMAALWCIAPFVVEWLDQSPNNETYRFGKEEEAELRGLSRDIWDFYEEYVTAGDNWLPPDNVQIEPDKGIAHRTSPTNIGMYAACALAARDFGFIDTDGLVNRLERTVSTIERMEKWEGHLYNWYDTETLAPLQPIYVSTVDSGNFAASLMAVREGLLEWLRADWRDRPGQGGDGQAWDSGKFEVAFSAELGSSAVDARDSAAHAAFPDKRRSGERGSSERGSAPGGRAREKAALMARGSALAERIDALVRATDFRPLHDASTNLFALGYHVERRKRDEVLYDLLASEARQASFVAIALGQISVSHWNALGRTLTKSAGRPVLLSWSGTMFEYLMPWLLMKTYRNSVWDSTYQAVVERQIQYASEKNVPFGISESGYSAFDHAMNYQYRAFGVPGLGFKRGLEQDLVLAPYATIMALPFAPQEGLSALKAMEKLGARGKYGYFEAIDFTPSRQRDGGSHSVIRSFMAHHQGMSLLTLSNLLLPRTMIQRFHQNKEVRSAELLLQERVPRRAKMIRHPAMHRSGPEREPLAKQGDPVREFGSPHTEIPEVAVLSNGRFGTVVTASGGGYMSWDGILLSRWREEPVTDGWGSFLYIHEPATGELWSPSYQPCRTETPVQKAVFEPDKAAFHRRYGDVEAVMEVCVSSESDAELRRITLTNLGSSTKVLEVTTFVELAMANPIADDAHPAFSKLFVRTAYDERSGCLVASRRKREADERELWTAHALTAEGQTLGSVEFETDRAAFIGRGFQLDAPQCIASRLKGKTGSVADPAFVMRRRVQLEAGEKAVLYSAVSAAATREAAIEGAARLTGAQQAERVFQMAWTRSRIELRSLHLELADVHAFQRLAAQALYTPPLSPGRRHAIAANSKGQSGLWSFGISGDRPIITVSIDNRSHLPFVMKLLTGHEYLRRLGIGFDLVIVNLSESGYHRDLQEALLRAVEHGVDRFGAGAAGIHVLPADGMAAEDLTLLHAVSRIALRAGGPSLSGQLRVSRRNSRKTSDGKQSPASRNASDSEQATADRNASDSQQSPAALIDRASPAPKSVGVPTDGAKPQLGESQTQAADIGFHANELQFFNGWGGFSANGKEYTMLIEGNKHLPAPWINVLSNPSFGALVSELGTGYTFWRNSRECKLTPWSNDPVLDPPGELGFLRDEESGRYWTLTPGSGHIASPYLVTHGLGYTLFRHERESIRHELTMYVPLADPVKIMRLKLTNASDAQRTLSVTYYAEWVIGVKRQSNASYVSTRWHEDAEIMTASNHYQETFREATPFLGIFAPPEASIEDGLSWTGDQAEFIGRNGSVERPAALGRPRLSNDGGSHYASCGAIRRKLVLEPGEEAEVILLLGCAASDEEAAELAKAYRSLRKLDQAWDETAAYWKETLEQITVDTPSPESNIMLGGWLLYQSLACRMWARSAFYQAGGAYGFRDQLQDSLALLHSRPELTRRQILLNAAHQYEEGDVQHWWHEETERGIRTLFSDDLLWLPYSASRYIEHTGDGSILDERVHYLTSAILREGEHERYEETVRSQRDGTIFEHCKLAIDKALSRMGEHGLPLIGVGDWNDGMNLAGANGRGESVWLGWFLYEVLQRFGELCSFRGEEELESHYRGKRERLAAALDEHAWDGNWYRRAFTDAGTWLGTVYNEECRIDSIAQSWSVISGAAPEQRALQAMQSFDRELVDRELSIIRLLTPPFDRTEPSPGYIQGYPPGIRENGAQYTHGVIWSIIAWTKLKRGDKAFELFRMLNPVNHTRTDQEVRKYFGEPYVMAADVYTADPHHGHAGWTWYTGASGWMYQSGIEWILGLRRRGNRLYTDPCIPAEWPGFRASYRFGNTRYHLDFRRGGASSEENGRFGLTAGPDSFIELVDDGKEHTISIRLPVKP